MGCTSCGGEQCLCGVYVTPEQVLGHTLLDSLKPVADCLRNLNTVLGARTYQVQLVWTRWTGGERGLGQEHLVHVEPLLPTPLVSPLKQLRQELVSIGLNEQGELEVTELSPSYTEDLLMGRDLVVPKGNDIPDDMQFYWEIYFPETVGQGVRRRFFPKSVPSYEATALQWKMQLVLQQGARARDGRLSA